MSRAARVPQLAVVEAAPRPERVALVEAVAAFADSRKEVDASSAAYDEAEQAVYGAHGAIDRAQAALAKAKADAEMPDVVLAARAAVDTAETSLVAARERRDVLKQRHDKNMGRRGTAEIGRNMALRSFLKSSPETRAVFNAFMRARAEFDRLEAVVKVLGFDGALPDDCRQYRMTNAPPAGVEDVARWKGAIEALKTDPHAKLPEVQ